MSTYYDSADESVESILIFVTNICAAAPISCSEIGIKPSDPDQLDSLLAFRAWIDDQLCAKFLDWDIWVNGIDIKEWKFKPKPPIVVNNENSDNKGDKSGKYPRRKREELKY